jgi:hypothetical protein
LAGMLADGLEASAPGIAKRLRSALPDMPPKAYQWVAEMKEVGGFDGPTPGGNISHRRSAKSIGMQDR